MRILVVTAMYPTLENPAFGSFVKSQVEALQQVGVEVEVLVLQGKVRKLMYLQAPFQLWRRLAGHSFDIVHAHYGLVGMVARTQWQVPLVVTFHGDDILGTVNKDGKKKFFSQVIAWGGRVLGQVADGVIVQSREMGSKFWRKDVHIVPHEVNLELFRPTDRDEARRALGLDPNKKYLLFAANPRISVKRFPLAKAVADYLQQQDPSIELLVVYKEPQSRLMLYMNASDALVFPSYQEGSPNIVKQAMACNMPIVATDVGDVRDIIGDTAGCFIAPPSVPEFAACLKEILSHRERTQGRKQVEHLSSPLVAERLIEVYEQAQRKYRTVLKA